MVIYGPLKIDIVQNSGKELFGQYDRYPLQRSYEFDTYCKEIVKNDFKRSCETPIVNDSWSEHLRLKGLI